MVVVINIDLLFRAYLGEENNYLPDIFNHITHHNPKHKFVFIGDKTSLQQFAERENVIGREIRPKYKHPLLMKGWYAVKLPTLLKKYKADLFVSFDGFCSLITKIPQCLILDELSFLHYPQGIKKRNLGFYKKNMAKYINKANRVITFSTFSKRTIAEHCKIHGEKVYVINKGVKENFLALPEEEKTTVKNKYTSGREYFIYAGPFYSKENLLILLKAFSVFKKRQQTGMKLLLAGKSISGNEQFLKSIASYKYRDDVVLTGPVPENEMAKIIASAYVFVSPFLYESAEIKLAEAIKCNVPVIAALHSAAQEVAGNAALYADVTDYHDLADKMMVLYKNENLHKELIEKSKEIALTYNWAGANNLLWKRILETAG